MEKKLMDAHLWSRKDGQLSEQEYSKAWLVLSRLGAPYRFSGRAFDGKFEYLILHPQNGSVVATGRGDSAPVAMFEAALAGRKALQV